MLVQYVAEPLTKRSIHQLISQFGRRRHSESGCMCSGTDAPLKSRSEAYPASYHRPRSAQNVSHYPFADKLKDFTFCISASEVTCLAAWIERLLLCATAYIGCCHECSVPHCTQCIRIGRAGRGQPTRFPAFDRTRIRNYDLKPYPMLKRSTSMEYHDQYGAPHLGSHPDMPWR